MSKAKQLLSVVMAIREEGEMGPLNLVDGQKVVVMKDGADIPASICSGDKGCYDQESDSYCVMMGDGKMEYVPSKMIKMGESKTTKVDPKLEARKKKFKESMEKMQDCHGTLMEHLDDMSNLAGDMEASKTQAHLEDLKGMASELPGLYEDEMSDFKGGQEKGSGVGAASATGDTELKSYDK